MLSIMFADKVVQFCLSLHCTGQLEVEVVWGGTDDMTAGMRARLYSWGAGFGHDVIIPGHEWRGARGSTDTH